ncbi:MAG TPA: RsmG family class I SAM-dependent methyltransferase [Halalkalibaculum sp.]|nr:RsmG family class I SAM-dependent methyltransferase [Halalkalibaculum sp.]
MKQSDITYRHVPRETFSAVDKLIKEKREQLEHFLDRLLWWNKRINLVSRDVPRETIFEHIRHSLLISGLQSYKDSSLIVDTGTGGGLPGIPLAIISPEKEFILNDIVTKKVMAIKQMARTLGLKNVSAVDFSIEKATIDSPFLLITKHAFKVNDLIRMTSGLPWQEIIFYKGMDFKEELEGIDTPLSITAYDLYKENKEPFYRDKALVVISRQ